MKKPETKLKEKIQKRLREVDGLWFAKIQSVTVRGIPDLLICYRGRLIAWELKSTKGRTDPLQEYNLDRIEKAGGLARVVSPEDVELAFWEDLGIRY